MTVEYQIRLETTPDRKKSKRLKSHPDITQQVPQERVKWVNNEGKCNTLEKVQTCPASSA